MMTIDLDNRSRAKANAFDFSGATQTAIKAHFSSRPKSRPAKAPWRKDPRTFIFRRLCRNIGRAWARRNFRQTAETSVRAQELP
jgi:hypothetical protein